MVRKKLSLILAIALLLTAASSFAFAETQERGKLTYGSTVDMDTDKEWYPTEFILYLQDMINADIEFIEYDNDTLQLALASGDMPDLMMVNTGQHHSGWRPRRPAGRLSGRIRPEHPQVRAAQRRFAGVRFQWRRQAVLPHAQHGR